MKKNVLFILLLCLLTAGFLLFSGCPIDNTDDLQQALEEAAAANDSDDDDSGDDSEEEEEIIYNVADTNKGVLEALGLSLDESDPENYNGDTVSDDENPLGTSICSLGTQYELFQVGATINSTLGRYSVTEYGEDGTSTRFSQYSAASTSTWLDLPKKAVAADIDQDGRDEVITAVFNGSTNTILIYYEGPGGTMYSKTVGTFDFMDDFGERTWATDDYFMRDFTTGDFDNDGYPDFALSCNTGVLILDHAFNVTNQLEMPTETNYTYVRVEAGDLNGDDYADLVVLYGRIFEDVALFGNSMYYLYAGSSGGLSLPSSTSAPAGYATLSGTLSDGDYSYCSGEVAIFDYDGDGLSELFLAAIRDDSGASNDVWGGAYAWVYPVVTVWDPYNETSGNWNMTYPVDPVAYDYINSNGGIHPRNVYVPRLAVGRFDGDDRDMCNVMDLIYYVNDSGDLSVWDKFEYTTWDSSACHNMVYDLAVAGDITGDGYDELVYMVFSDLPWYNANNSGDRTQTIITSLVVWGEADGSFDVIKEYSFTSSSEYPTLALANVDNDTVVVEYAYHELVYSDPLVLAVMASPPYYEDIMEIGDSETTYTVTSETTTTDSGSVGLYLNYSVGVFFEVGEAGGAVGTALNADIEQSWSYTWGTSYSRGTSLTYTVDAGYDQVVFTGFPIDMYAYKILNAPADYYSALTPDDNGDYYVTINIPRSPSTNSMEVSAYNRLVEEEYRIPDSILNHTIGDPYSYYSAADKADLEDEGDEYTCEGSNDQVYGYLFSEGTQTVAQGYGTTAITTWGGDVSTSGFDYCLAGGITNASKAGYISSEISVGVTCEFSYEYNVSDGIEAGGVVGSIPDEDEWSENNFEWGLMMIPREFEDQCFNFVTYWVVAD